MISSRMKTLRVGLALLTATGGLVMLPAAAAAQAKAQQGEDPGTALTRHLRTLSDQPRSLTALSGAGRAALDLGDPQAALTFFGRAEEIAPQDGRVKAGMAAALVQMEDFGSAMRLFEEAASLGVPPAEFAGDRGLAYDLAGDPRRAQADYNLSLRHREDPEVRRRLALSLAISGEREKAISVIDAQLRRQDRAAWRTRAFVLALTGNASEATKAAQAVMPAQAAELQPFFAKLPSLSPGQRAMAVHFGHFPGDGQPVRTAANTQFASSSAAVTAAAPPSRAVSSATQAGRPDSAQKPLGSPSTASAQPKPVDKAPPKPTQSASRATVGPSASGPPASSAAKVQSPPPAVAQAPATVPAPREQSTAPPSSTASNLGALVQNLPSETTQTVVPAPSQPQPQPLQTAEARPPAAAAPDPAPVQADAPAAGRSFAEIAAAIAALPQEEPAPAPTQSTNSNRTQLALADPKPAAAPPRAEPKPAAPKPTPASKPAAKTETAAKKTDAARKEEPGKKGEAAKTAAKKDEPAKKGETSKSAAKKAEPAAKETSRHWVQVAGGANKAAMTTEFSRLKTKAPKLLANRTAWTTPLKATNRLLVGPFKSVKEAQEFVNQLAKLDLSAFTWTSPAGQEIVKLSSK
jgi:Flp pilus assembly protein TadD